MAHDTYRQVRGVFNVQPHPVSGENIPPVYLIQGAKPRAFRLSSRGVEGVETRMIGREAELRHLQDALETAVEDRAVQLVTVVGEAGLGKSRLLYEFQNWYELRPALIRIFQGRSDQSRQNIPFALIRDLFAWRFQVLDDDSAAVARLKLEEGFVSFMGEAGREASHFIGHLLGFDFTDSPYIGGILDDARQLRERAMHDASQFFTAVTDREPAVILLEDIHWADEGSLDLINHILRYCPDIPLLVVATARPTLFEQRPAWGAEYELLELDALSRRDSRRLVQEILQKVPEIPQVLQETIISNAEGNPFYMEELVKILIEEGVIVTVADNTWQIVPERLITLRVPPTLVGVLQARLDRLPAAERGTLQRAAVIGRVFWESAVASLAETENGEETNLALASLAARELIFRRETSSFAGTAEYLFKHALLHEVVYESLLKRERRDYHRRAADWLAAQAEEQVAAHAQLIASHYEQAGAAREAAVWYSRAGRQAQGIYAHGEATTWYKQALEILNQQEPNAGSDALKLFAHKALGDVLGLTGRYDEALGHYEAARSLLESNTYEQTLELAGLCRQTGEIYEKRNEYEQVRYWLEKGLGYLNENEPSVELVRLYHFMGWFYMRQGQYEAAQDLLKKALALASALQVPQLEASSLRHLGTAYWYLAQFVEAHAYWQQSLHTYQRIGDRHGQGMTLNNLSLVAIDQSDYLAARDYSAQALLIFQKVGNRWAECMALNNLGHLYRRLGNYEHSMELLEQALPIGQELGDRQTESMIISNLGFTTYYRGDLEAADTYTQQSLLLTRQLGVRRDLADALTCRGHVLVAQQHFGEAAELYQEAIALRNELGQSNMTLDAQAGLARVWLAQGGLNQALVQVEQILGYLEHHTAEGNDDPLWIHLTCYDVLHAADDGRAYHILKEVYNSLQERAQHIQDEQLRRSYLERVTTNQQIVAAWQS
jgi:predicted ATPase